AGDKQQLLDFHGINLQDDAFGWFLQQTLPVLPKDSVKKGSKWKATADAKLAGIGQLTGQTDYTLEKGVTEEKRTVQEIRWKGEQTLDLDMKWLKNALNDKLKTKKLTGAGKFDAKVGAVQSSKVEAEITGELKLGNPDSPAILRVSFQHTLELEAKP